MRALLLFAAATVLGAAALVPMTACSSSDSKAAPTPTSDGGVASGVRDPASLFDPLPPATPNVLRGVWESKSSVDNGTVVVRLGFTEEFLSVAVRCTPKTGATVDVPDVVGWDSKDIDKQSGTFDYDGISISGEDDAGTKCGTELPAGPLDFKIDGTKLTLTKQGVAGDVTFDKVGD